MTQHRLLSIGIALGLILTCAVHGGTTTGVPTPMRIGLTPVFLDNQPRILRAWRHYLEQQLDRKVAFVQRGTYREIVEGLSRGELDAAWLCGLPFVERRSRLALVAAPVYQGAPLYRSYLIVRNDDTKTNSWKDLPAGVFAFADPDSNSGYLYPKWAMQTVGLDPETHFRKHFFAHGHRNVIEAVAVGLADAGAVDGYVWDTLTRDRPEITSNTRVVLRSETFGFPPIVARAGWPEQAVRDLQKALVGMASDRDGQDILRQLNLDGFAKVKPALYESIAKMSRAVGRTP